jgi:hypothetical protein
VVREVANTYFEQLGYCHRVLARCLDAAPSVVDLQTQRASDLREAAFLLPLWTTYLPHLLRAKGLEKILKAMGFDA